MSKPSIFTQLVSLTKAVTIHAASGLKSANDEEQQKRALICSECPELIEESYRCGVCNCLLKYKIKWATSECPKGKWSKENG